MKKKFLNITHKSLEDFGVDSYQKLWEKMKGDYEGISVTLKAEFQKSAEVDNSFHAIFSTDSEDRHGDVVVQDFDLKSFKKNPVFLDSHNYDSITHILGKISNASTQTGKLEGDIEFFVDNPKGLLAKQAVEQGFLNATSIGFIPKQFDDKGKILKSELLEVSGVSVPAQGEALFEKMIKGVVPFVANPTRPEGASWDANAVQDEVWQNGENQAKYAKIHAFFDDGQADDDGDGYPDVKSAYKLPHHDASLKVVWAGVAAAMAAFLGARGGVNIPDDHKQGVYDHLAKHYAQFDKPCPAMKEYNEAELKAIEEELLVEKKEEIKQIEIKTGKKASEVIADMADKRRKELKALAKNVDEFVTNRRVDKKRKILQSIRSLLEE